MSYGSIWLHLSIFIYSSLQTVDTLGPPKVLSGVLDYNDDTLFDGKPVISETRRQGNEGFEQAYPRYPYPGEHPEYLRQQQPNRRPPVGEGGGRPSNKGKHRDPGSRPGYKGKHRDPTYKHGFDGGASESEEEDETVNKKDTPPPTGITEARESFENLVTWDYMNIRDKYVINKMINQLFQESELKVHEVNQVIQMHTAAMGFEVGKIIGLIQARYRLQMELWREVSDKEIKFGYPPRTRAWPATWSIYYIRDHRNWYQYAETKARMNNYYITMYAMIFEIERDIEKLIDILLAIPRADLQLPEFTMKSSELPNRGSSTGRGGLFFKTTPEQYTAATTKGRSTRLSAPPTPPTGPPDPPKGLRAGDDSPKWMPGGAGLRRGVNFEEEKLKHRMREQFLLKRLGRNVSGHTLKPRFRRGWPVDDTWDNIPLY